MTPTICPHEHAVVAEVTAGRWPAASDDALRAHVHACADCREALAIAQALQAVDRAVDVPVPSAAQMWWRLAVRARLEREQAAARPVVWWQGIAGACGIGLSLAALGQAWPRLTATSASVGERVRALVPASLPDVPWPHVPATAAVPGVVVAAGVALAVLAASAALYLWVADE